MSTTQQNTKPQRAKKLTDYGYQLKEKQSAKRSYGLNEEQFRKYYNAAAKFTGQTGVVLLTKLEKRLDNALYRAGFAISRAQARQLVSHRHVYVNGTRVSIPSIEVKQGDKIQLRDKIELPEHTKCEVSWIKDDRKKRVFEVVSAPTQDDLPIEFDTQKIIEFYSR